MNKIFKKIVKRFKEIKISGNYKTSILRHEQNKTLKEFANTYKNIKSILNIGARQLDDDKEGEKYKDYFKGCEYYTLDKNKNEMNEYHFNLDLHNLSNLTKKFDLIICMNTLEHVRNPFGVAKEISNLIKPGGYLFVSIPFFYPIHKDILGRYGDYWRLTDDGLKILFSNLDEIWIKKTSSVIKKVKDRPMYWTKKETPSGFIALFKN